MVPTLYQRGDLFGFCTQASSKLRWIDGMSGMAVGFQPQRAEYQCKLWHLLVVLP